MPNFIKCLGHSAIRRGAAATALLAAVVLSGMPQNATAETVDQSLSAAALQLVRSVVNDGTEAISSARDASNAPDTVFLGIFEDRFSTETIGQSLLGQYWDQAVGTERNQFLAAFSGYLSEELIRKFPEGEFSYFDAEYATTSTDERPRVVVKTVFNTRTASVVINWGVENLDGTLRIFDISLRNKSLIQNKYEEFQNILVRNNGSVRSLIDIIEG
jgi:ABC-type transporter MlaC component